MDEIIQFLAEQDADIVLLQEVYNSKDSNLKKKYRSVTIFQEKLAYQYFNFAPAHLDIYDFGKVVQGNLVLSKFPIIDSDSIFFAEPYGERDPFDSEAWPKTPRNLQHVVLSSPGGELNVFNFHGVWDLEGDSYSTERQKMSQSVIGSTKGKKNVILAGDTNAKPTNKAIREIERYLISVFGNKLTTTFNMRRKENPGYATAAVDMIFVSSNIEVLDRGCIDIDLSDHLPVMATFQIK